MEFTELEIQRLFGSEAAEEEEPDRLKQYYFKNKIYNQVITDLPLRILVGHKGIGKSALFRIAIDEETEQKRLTILIKPNDIADIGTETDDFLKLIQNWKIGITEIIASKALESFGIPFDGFRSQLNNYGGKLLSFLSSTIKVDKFNLTPAKREILSRGEPLSNLNSTSFNLPSKKLSTFNASGKSMFCFISFAASNSGFITKSIPKDSVMKLICDE